MTALPAPDDKIIRALSGKKTGLLDDARQLLNALEYKSERTLNETHSAPDFLRQYDPKNGEGVNACELKKRAGKIGIVFQVTDEEIRQDNGLYASAFQPDDERSFIFVAVDLKGDHYPRWRLARMTRAVNRCFASPAVVLFRHPDADGNDSVSLSFIHRRESKTDSAKDVLGRVSVLRAVRREKPHRGHLNILQDLALSERLEWMRGKSKPLNFAGLLAAWLAALDIEELNRRFYEELQEWFDRAVRACKFPDGNSKEKKQAQVMRMITRLLFIWFVKEKGLAPGDLFTESFARAALKNHQPDNSNYYRAVLQNLFFGTLNTPREERGFRKRNQPAPGERFYDDQHGVSSVYRYADLLADQGAFKDAVAPIPFVNGGLFDCLDDLVRGRKKAPRADSRNPRNRVDCFTDYRKDRALLHVPSRLFFDGKEGLFPLFDRYKFTVAENTPVNQEVALDPELLGLVFENLLAAVIPESSESARKSTGSYYTPREIVEYMVDEALVAYFTGRLGGKSEPRLRKLMSWEEPDEALFSEKENKAIIDAIDELRILDPAVGSGAFPMGMLHKLVHILSRVDEHNEEWKKKQLDSLKNMPDSPSRREARSAIERVFAPENNYDDYGRKLFLIQHAIHGADMQPMAAQIARLRFFISLVIDQKPHDKKDNCGIDPLPNLETKFVTADSLVRIMGRREQMSLAEDRQVQDLQNDLNLIRRDYFSEKTLSKKIRLQSKDEKLRGKLEKALERSGFVSASARRVASWNPYDQTAGADWFDAELMMGVRDGFDIVIGNPPYVRHELFAAKKPVLRAQFGNFFSGTADLYTYFYHRGLSELRNGGHLSFITSNKFMRVGYGENTRELLANKATLRTLVDFGELPVFKAATDPAIVIAKNIPPPKKAALTAAVVKKMEDIQRVGEFIRERGFAFPVSALSADEWSVEGGGESRMLLEKIRRVGRPLCKSSSAQICMGIKTGLNSAFLIDNEKRRQLIAGDASSAKIIRPWIRGRDIMKWKSPRAELHIVAISSSANQEWAWSEAKTKRQAEKIFAAKHPAVFEHLAAHKSELSNRADQGVFWWELRSCAYYGAFANSKIVYPDIAKLMRASYDETGALCDATSFIIPMDDLSILGAVHSKAFDWFARQTFRSLGDPWNDGRLRFKKASMEKFPFPPMDKGDKAEISRRVKAILRSPSGSEVPRLEGEIDEIVNRLYGLTPSEVRLVGGGG